MGLEMTPLLLCLFVSALINDGGMMNIHLGDPKGNMLRKRINETFSNKTNPDEGISYDMNTDGVNSRKTNQDESLPDETNTDKVLSYLADLNQTFLDETHQGGAIFNETHPGIFFDPINLITLHGEAKSGAIYSNETNADAAFSGFKVLVGRHAETPKSDEAALNKTDLSETIQGEAVSIETNPEEALLDVTNMYEDFLHAPNLDETLSENMRSGEDLLAEIHMSKAAQIYANLNKIIPSDLKFLDQRLTKRDVSKKRCPALQKYFTCISRVKKWRRKKTKSRSVPEPPFVALKYPFDPSASSNSVDLGYGSQDNLGRESNPVSWTSPERRPFSPSSPDRTVPWTTSPEWQPLSPPSPNRATATNGSPTSHQKNGIFTDVKGTERKSDKWPIVYREEYNINVAGYQSLLGDKRFDLLKSKNVFLNLVYANMVSEQSISVPDEADIEVLPMAHTPEYLKSLQDSKTIANIVEVKLLRFTSRELLDERLLKPMRFQVGGSLLAGELAIHRGWAINLGGGFHHASADRGRNYNAYADVAFMIKWLFQYYPNKVKTAMVVNLDAHHGDGLLLDFIKDGRVFILDVYNKDADPKENMVTNEVKWKVELRKNMQDEEYLDIVRTNLENALGAFHPDILVYNAGTDILNKDPVGMLAISAEGIIERDKIVFTAAKSRKIPIAMLLGGGFLKEVAAIIARSILNLKELQLISK